MKFKVRNLNRFNRLLNPLDVKGFLVIGKIGIVMVTGYFEGAILLGDRDGDKDREMREKKELRTFYYFHNSVHVTISL